MTISAFILEDEPKAANVLKRMLGNQCENLDQIWHFNSVEAGSEALEDIAPTLAFLDIHLPDGSGFDLLTQLKTKGTAVIFTSAHSQYAIEALRQDAKDYLVKPYTSSELRAAIERAMDTVSKENHGKKGIRISLQTERFTHLIGLDELAYCEAHGNYTKIHLKNGREIVISRTLKQFEDQLGQHGFIRIHRTFMVNSRFITGLEKQDGGSVVLEGNVLVPISRRKKDEVLELISQMSNYKL